MKPDYSDDTPQAVLVIHDKSRALRRGFDLRDRRVGGREENPEGRSPFLAANLDSPVMLAHYAENGRQA